MKKKELILIASVYDILDKKLEFPKELDEELIKKLLDEQNRFSKKERIFSIRCASVGLRIRKENPKKTRREIIQLVLKEIKDF
jgi:hypothetical protein